MKIFPSLCYNSQFLFVKMPKNIRDNKTFLCTDDFFFIVKLSFAFTFSSLVILETEESSFEKEGLLQYWVITITV